MVSSYLSTSYVLLNFYSLAESWMGWSAAWTFAWTLEPFKQFHYFYFFFTTRAKHSDNAVLLVFYQKTNDSHKWEKRSKRSFSIFFSCRQLKQFPFSKREAVSKRETAYKIWSQWSLVMAKWKFEKRLKSINWHCSEISLQMATGAAAANPNMSVFYYIHVCLE